MPNHITTEIITLNPDVVLALTGGETYEDRGTTRPKVEFGRIIQPPDHPDYTAGGCSHSHGLRFLTGDVSADPHPNCWYPWNITNWGTKWGAYRCEFIEGGVRFETAWSHPYPVIEALSKMFPDDSLRVRYADEDIGSNLGDYFIANGEISENEIAEPEDFATRLVYGRPYAELKAEWDDD